MCGFKPTLHTVSCHKQAAFVLLQTQASSERFVNEVERRWGVKFPEGRNPDLTFMAHLWEPLRSVPSKLARSLCSVCLFLWFRIAKVASMACLAVQKCILECYKLEMDLDAVGIKQETVAIL